MALAQLLHLRINACDSYDDWYITVDWCRKGTALNLLGSPERELAQMQTTIVEQETLLFLLNFQTLKLVGPYLATDLPALDIVANKKGLKFFEVPTGWKFFGNLMDSGTAYFPDGKTYTPFICGEESFGTGADHVREKDGMWAVLAWLQILAAKNTGGTLVTVEDVAKAHWAEYGRNYYARYDYEGVDKPKSEEMMKMMSDKAGTMGGQVINGMTIKTNDVFEYNDPVDGSVSKNQGLRFIFEDGSRIIFRLSGTGVAGATVRMYLEKYVPPSGDLAQHAFDVILPLAAIAMEISKLPTYTGRDTPTVIT